MATNLELLWHDRDDTTGDAGRPLNQAYLGKTSPSLNAETPRYFQALSGSKRGCVLKANTLFKLIDSDNSHWIFMSGDDDVQISDLQTMLDTGSSFGAGKNYYIYLCSTSPLSGASLVVSLNSTYPDGWSATSSRKIGGFHTECANVGSISGHPLSGWTAGDILPGSFWTLKFRPTCDPEGFVYVDGLGKWVSIYFLSYTNSKLVSTYGGTVADGESSTKFHGFKFIEEMGKVGMRLPTWDEFNVFAKGSNEGTNIYGSADPTTTGGHKDTNSRRMVSNYGLEDCCGMQWQWCSNTGTQANTATHNTGEQWINYGGGTGIDFWSDDWSWNTDVDGTTKYGQVGGAFLVRLLAGGSWGDGAACGSRSAYCLNGASSHAGGFGARGVSEPLAVCV